MKLCPEPRVRQNLDGRIGEFGAQLNYTHPTARRSSHSNQIKMLTRSCPVRQLQGQVGASILCTRNAAHKSLRQPRRR